MMSHLYATESDAFSFEDQHMVPDMKYLPNIKLEQNIIESYYPITIDLNSTKMATLENLKFNCTHLIGSCNPYPMSLHKSDGECSPLSFDGTEVNSLSLNTNHIKPQKIQRRSHQKSKRGSMCGKSRNRLSTSSSLSDCSYPKEKDRAKLFNEAFDGLRRRIPSIPSSKKLSKIEILRLAICYMSYLKFLTAEEDSAMHILTEIDIDKMENNSNSIEMQKSTIKESKEEKPTSLSDRNHVRQSTLPE